MADSKVNRRGFLGIFGAAAAAGPATLKASSTQMLRGLSTPEYWPGTVADTLDQAGPCPSSGFIRGSTNVSSLDKTLNKLLGMSKDDEDWRIRAQNLYELEPDAAALVSVNLQTKMWMSRRATFRRAKRLDERALRYQLFKLGK